MEIDLLHHELQSYYLLTLPEFVTKTFSSEIDCITHGVRLTNILLDWFMLFYKNSIISFLFSLEETVSQQKKMFSPSIKVVQCTVRRSTCATIWYSFMVHDTLALVTQMMKTSTVATVSHQISLRREQKFFELKNRHLYLFLVCFFHVEWCYGFDIVCLYSASDFVFVFLFSPFLLFFKIKIISLKSFSEVKY